MGWLGIALGFGLPFAFVITMFGYISALLNPAACLAEWILGNINGCGSIRPLRTTPHYPSPAAAAAAGRAAQCHSGSGILV
jgi:glycerol uptake facilitator-like aquaporin